MSQILVIGANSALAQAVIPVLNVHHKVVTAGRSGCDVVCDITQSITIPEKTDVVVNVAALFEAETDEAIIDTYQTNVLGLLRVCMAARKAGVKHVIQLSSLSAVLPADSPYYNTYAITKRQADEAASYYCITTGLPLTILRPSQIYGNSSEFARHQPFFYNIIDKAEKGEDVTIYGTNDALRNYIHSDDLADVIRGCIEQTITGIYACTYPSDTSFSQVANAAQRVFGMGGTVRFLEDQPDTPNNTFDNTGEIYQLLRRTPQVTLEAGIELLKTYREGNAQ